MADSYVCSGAMMKCTMGTCPAKLTVLPSRTVFLTGQPMANISDHQSMVNLAPFGLCRSLAFPPTAAATAAALGVLTPQPCIHKTPIPWMGGKMDYLVQNQPALLKSCTCQCLWGGTISLITDGQVGEGTQWVQKMTKVAYPHKELQLVDPPVPKPSVKQPPKTEIVSKESVSINKTLQEPKTKDAQPKTQNKFETQQQAVKAGNKKYKLVLKDAYWEKGEMKIRFIPHQMRVNLILAFQFAETQDEGTSKENAKFYLNFEVPDTIYQQKQPIVINGNDLLHCTTSKDEEGKDLYLCKIENFTTDITQSDSKEIKIKYERTKPS